MIYKEWIQPAKSSVTGQQQWLSWKWKQFRLVLPSIYNARLYNVDLPRIISLENLQAYNDQPLEVPVSQRSQSSAPINRSFQIALQNSKSGHRNRLHPNFLVTQLNLKHLEVRNNLDVPGSTQIP